MVPSDTSRIATDHINNPNTINPIFLLAERERIAANEQMAGGTLALPGEKATMPVPHILKDGADSVGVPGATIRVYVNIGMFSEYWLTLHNRLIGLKPQSPFEVATAQKNSVFGARPRNASAILPPSFAGCTLFISKTRRRQRACYRRRSRDDSRQDRLC